MSTHLPQPPQVTPLISEGDRQVGLGCACPPHRRPPRRLRLEGPQRRWARQEPGPCGLCWSFSTPGALEGANYLVTAKMEVLSEQQMVNCDHEVNGKKGPEHVRSVTDNAKLDASIEKKMKSVSDKQHLKEGYSIESFLESGVDDAFDF
ncbi:hypothetical protein GUJ93_ZPchr0004g38610 [Zizania palustris]|uniref:Peptidase C1A papain C-terminal domain-containing protein n=1 Tax=Zizania palustris TaxID=103762 RepID=A0A8J5VNW0_ZIZPA|nr:hypothetical protein GUJ93_ZPchr0004g38610 [Zizania palustris]